MPELVELVARIYTFGTKTRARTHWAHGAIAFAISLLVTLGAHLVVFRWLTLFGGLSGAASWLLAGSYGLVAGASFYTNREIEQGIRKWLSGRVEGVDVYFRDQDPRWDVFAAWIGSALPGPLLAFGPDLLAFVF